MGGAYYDLQVRRFVPMHGDSMCRYWKSKEIQQQYLCAPYAIASMTQTASVFTHLVDANVKTFIEHYTDETDKLIRNTYSMDYRYSQVVEVSIIDYSFWPLRPNVYFPEQDRSDALKIRSSPLGRLPNGKQTRTTLWTGVSRNGAATF